MKRLELPKSLGQKIRQVRLESGLSQEALADRAGLHRTYMGLVERGESNISLVKYAMIAEALDMSLSELLEGLRHNRS